MKRSREPEEDLDSDSQAGDSNVELRPVAKITELGADAEIDHEARGRDPAATAMKCALPPHKDPILFRSYSEYESHYNKFHTNRCLECRKNFPSAHLLSVHIEEFHDPLVVVRRDKGEHTYSCFVEGCKRKCLTHQKRRMHMIDKHMYPKNYFFGITKDGIDGRQSLLIDGGHRRRKSSTSTQPKEPRRRESLKGLPDKPQKSAGSGDDEEDQGGASSGPKADAEMKDLADAMSSLHFVPHSVRFRRGRAGFPKR